MDNSATFPITQNSSYLVARSQPWVGRPHPIPPTRNILKEAKIASAPIRMSGKRGIQSITVGASILRVLTATSGPMHLRDLAKESGMPASKAYRYLVSLGAAGMIRQVPQTGQYDLGPLSSEIGLAALGRIDAVEIVTAELSRLTLELNHDAHVTIWTTHGPMVLRWKQGSDNIAIRISEGATMPLLTTATGRIWCCYLPATMTSELINAQLDDTSRKAGQSKGQLRRLHTERLEQIRGLGFSHSEGERRPGIDALSAPIFGPNGLAFAMTLLGSHGDVDFRYDGPSTQRLLATTNRISRQLGAVRRSSPNT
jgi:DNA-binding IclR family transcriptional regulator